MLACIIGDHLSDHVRKEGGGRRGRVNRGARFKPCTQIWDLRGAATMFDHQSITNVGTLCIFEPSSWAIVRISH